MSEMSIQVDKRERTGKGGNRQARMRGQIPAVVYGSGKDSVPIQVNRKSFIEMMRKAGSENPVLLLKLSDTGQERVILSVVHTRTEETPGAGEQAEPEVIKRGKTEE